MMLLFVEYIPWIAFIGAGLLVSWVGADIARSRLRKPRTATPEAQDSGRGLAGPPERLKVEPQVEQATEVVAEQLEIEPAEELVLPVTQAVKLTDEVAEPEAEVEAEADPVQPAELEAEPEPELSEETVSGEMMLVRRDPSVRVFDAVVAPSERKVLTNED